MILLEDLYRVSQVRVPRIRKYLYNIVERFVDQKEALNL